MNPYTSDREIIGSCCDPRNANAHVIAYLRAQQDEHVWARDHAMVEDWYTQQRS